MVLVGKARVSYGRPDGFALLIILSDRCAAILQAEADKNGRELAEVISEQVAISITNRQR